MTTSTTPPLLTPLPPAPLPTDAEALFDAKAGASLTAQAVMVGEVNTALNWQADSMAATAGSMTAAASSATAAAASATAAAGSVVSAQAQVGLAAVQAGNAAASANSAQVAAAAAGSAAGLPSVVGHGGQALVAKKDESGFELKALDQAIGDVLETSRVPDSTYLLPNTIYSKSAYPVLAAMVGSLDLANDAANFASINPSMSSGLPATNIYRAIGCGKDNVFIAVGNTASGQGSTYSSAIRSVDGGLTWSSVGQLSNVYSLVSIVTDGKGVWLAGSYSNIAYRSSDNGVTWTALQVSGVSAANCIVTNGNGVWVASSANNSDSSISRSIDNGLTFNQLFVGGLFLAGVMRYDGRGALYSLGGSSITYYKSLDNGTSWSTIYASGQAGLALPMGDGEVLIMHSEYKLFVSVDSGVTWVAKLSNVNISENQIYIDKDRVIYVQPSTSGLLYKSYDFGDSWVVIPWVQTFFKMGSFNNNLAVDSNGVWLMTYGYSFNTFQRSTRLFNYDSMTQFKTPNHKSSKGYKSYIKAKLQ